MAYSSVYESEDLAESSVSYTIHVHIQKAYDFVCLGIWRLHWDLRFVIHTGTSWKLIWSCTGLNTESSDSYTEGDCDLFVWYVQI